MKAKDNVLHIRLDADLLASLNDIAQRLGDDNTSAATRMVLRTGLAVIEGKSSAEIIAAYANPTQEP